MPNSKFVRKLTRPADTRGALARPSYLSEVKAELAALIAEHHATSEEETREIVADLWPFVSEKLRQSFHNGVRAGASGSVQPKAQRQPGRVEGD